MLQIEERLMPPDMWSQVRQWIAIAIMVGGLMWLVDLGRGIGSIESRVIQNGATVSAVSTSLGSHLRYSNDGFRDVARLVSDLDSRISKLEGREEARSASGG